MHRGFTMQRQKDMQVFMEQIIRREPKLSESIAIGNTTIKLLNRCTENDGSVAECQSVDLDDNEYDVEYLELTDEEWRIKLTEAIQKQQNGLDECGNLSSRDSAVSIDRTDENNLYELFTCELCGTNFITENDRDSHLLSHQVRTEFCVENHKKSRSSKKIVRIQKNTIANQNNKHCSVCKKSFRYNSLLSLHMKYHGKNTFICDICGRGTKTKALLKRHLLSHNNEKPYECNICGEKVKHKTGLSTHMRIHTGEKPYSCEICAKVYAHCSDLRRHRTTHGIFKQVLNCTECPKVFYEMKFLRKHVKSHERNKDTTRKISRN